MTEEYMSKVLLIVQTYPCDMFFRDPSKVRKKIHSCTFIIENFTTIEMWM